MKTTSLDISIRYIKGVGEAREKLMNKLGINTLRDLVGYFPRAYEDRTVFKTIDSLVIGETVCVRAIAAATPRLSHIRKGLDLVKLRAVDESGAFELTFFNQPFVKDMIKQGDSYVFYGKISGTSARPEMTNPLFERDRSGDSGGRGSGGGTYGGRSGATGTTYSGTPNNSTNGTPNSNSDATGTTYSGTPNNSTNGTAQTLTGRIMPIYPLTARLSQKMVMNAVRSGLDKCGDELPDVLPDSIVRHYELCRARYAFENIHFPAGFKELDIARRRLIFEELFVLVTAMRLLRKRRGTQTGRSLTAPDFGEFYNALSFKPTGAQIRAIEEAASDMASDRPMSRLIQGDVGSGKTLVAAACCWMTWRSGAQSAFMAPTEILAKQHFHTLSELLNPFGMQVGLLTGSMTAKAKRETYEKLSAGIIDLIIGTHALISEGVKFSDLALVITDEQHRFGVNQRSMLTEKGDSPHVLVMSATPIPRTLALIIYGDLDVSVIDEMPPGRREIETHIVDERYRKRAYAFVEKLVAQGRQVYIICPMVEDEGLENADMKHGNGHYVSSDVKHSDGSYVSSDTKHEAGSYISSDNIKSVKEYHETLSKKVFPHLCVAIVHGKMPTKEKDAAMAAFASGEADILVATTVVEVGVDVANAALIIIENADRFGLSQLHQLRGRVGRGEHDSYCVLFRTSGGDNTSSTGSNDSTSSTGTGTSTNTGKTTNVSRERLEIMKATNDGFKIAEEDLKLRGPGDFFGSRQHGLPEMRIANFATDMLVLNQAQNAAGELLRADPELSSPENRQLAQQIKRIFEINTDKLN